MKNMGLSWRIILKWALKKEDNMAWIGFN